MEAVWAAAVLGDVELTVVADELVLAFDLQDEAAVGAGHQAAALRDYRVWKEIEMLVDTVRRKSKIDSRGA